MQVPLEASELLEREFLPLRAKILEIAAALDRIERGAGDVARDPRWQLAQRGLKTLLETPQHRAEAIQMLFSLPYHADWWQRLDMSELRAEH
jgi:hypothetical protein